MSYPLTLLIRALNVPARVPIVMVNDRVLCYTANIWLLKILFLCICEGPSGSLVSREKQVLTRNLLAPVYRFAEKV